MNIVLIMKLQKKRYMHADVFSRFTRYMFTMEKEPNVRELKGHRDARTILKLKLIYMYVFQEGKKLRAI